LVLPFLEGDFDLEGFSFLDTSATFCSSFSGDFYVQSISFTFCYYYYYYYYYCGGGG
jgi:hypothetical protein